MLLPFIDKFGLFDFIWCEVKMNVFACKSARVAGNPIPLDYGIKWCISTGITSVRMACCGL